MNTLETLARTIEARKSADPDSSWTARLLATGPDKCAEKFGEEAVEAIIAAVKNDRENLVNEAADVLYHLTVMLAARDVTLDEVLADVTTLETLAHTIEARKSADPDSSWTARLLAKGPDKCAEKFGEKAVDAIIAAVKNDRENLVNEAADVLYHLTVMLAARDVALDEVMAELDRRQGTSGIAEKASRKG
jgi:phosphoribosyl-ATP pyrophosphohydrolase